MEVLVRDIIKKAEEKLKEAGVVDFAVDSWLLAEFVFKINRTGFYMDPMMTVSKDRADKYMELVGIRASKIPLQHITGSQEFMGLDFKVNEDVLIPRQDTELLVENAITYIKSVKGNVDVLDMCTGSGCIAISIDRLCENAKVTAVDFSGKALVVAKENNALMDEVRIHEPMMALDGDCDGLKFYKKIAKEGRQHLRSNGIIFFEIGYDQGQTVPAILEENGYKDIKVYKDLSGNDRVVTAGKE